jgi:protein-S-isoprenylcysteine O-methyltransferase Ste14
MRPLRATTGSATFFLAAPGVVAGGVPWLLSGWEVARPVPRYRMVLVAVGILLLAAGVTVLTHAFVRFVREGRGTPAPVAPTERLVVGGLYRYVRNPMYIAVIAIIVGQALVFGHPLLLAYATAVWAATAAFVHWYEEPILAKRFGAGYDATERPCQHGGLDAAAARPRTATTARSHQPAVARRPRSGPREARTAVTLRAGMERRSRPARVRRPPHPYPTTRTAGRRSR